MDAGVGFYNGAITQLCQYPSQFINGICQTNISTWEYLIFFGTIAIFIFAVSFISFKLVRRYKSNKIKINSESTLQPLQ
jgi:hypothetical protein